MVGLEIVWRGLHVDGAEAWRAMCGGGVAIVVRMAGGLDVKKCDHKAIFLFCEIVAELSGCIGNI